MSRSRVLLWLLAPLVVAASCSSSGEGSGGGPSVATSGKSTASVPLGTNSVAPTTPSQGEKVRVALVVPTTGPLAAFGESASNGAKLAKEMLGSMDLGKSHPIDLVVYDAGESVSTTVNAYNKAVADGADLVIGPMFSGPSSAVAAVAVREKRLLLTGGSAIKVADFAPWTFRIHPSASYELSAQVRFLVEELGLSKIAVLRTNDEAGQAGTTAANAALEKYGLSVHADISHSPDDRDFGPVLRQVVDSGADGMIVFEAANTGALIMQQRSDLGIKLPMIGNGIMANSLVLDLVDGKQAAGTYVGLVSRIFDDGFVPDASIGLSTADVRDAYAKAYGLPIDQNAAYYFDAVLLAAKTLDGAGGDISQDSLQASFLKIQNFAGVSNTYNADATGETSKSTSIVQLDEQKVPKVVKSFDD